MQTIFYFFFSQGECSAYKTSDYDIMSLQSMVFHLFYIQFCLEV